MNRNGSGGLAHYLAIKTASSQPLGAFMNAVHFVGIFYTTRYVRMTRFKHIIYKQ